jgi:acetyl esterase/lipase
VAWPELVPVSEEEAAEAEALGQAVVQLFADSPPIHEVPPEETRRARKEGRGLFPPPVLLDRCTTEVLVGPDGDDLPVRVCPPADGEPRAIYLHLHGGGWVLGDHEGQDEALAAMADGAGVLVLSVGYRLAPEHPFPAGPDDCEHVARWIVEEGRGRFGLDAFVLGGESAGAHLALLTALRLRDRHGLVDAALGLHLVYGAYDFACTPSQRAWGDRQLVLSEPTMRWFYGCATPGLTDAERQDPEISPLYADLFGLPPCHLAVGTLDPLLDDSLFLHQRLLAADGDSTLQVWPGAVHGFTGIPHALGRRATASGIEWVAGVVHDAAR